MSEEGLDIGGLGKIAKAIPTKAWAQLVDTACNVFEQLLAPITATTSGIGRLIQAKFDRLVDAEKVLAADMLERATKRARIDPNVPPVVRANVFIAILEEAATETDVNLRELWANLLAQEISNSDIHPEVVRILSRLTAADAMILAQLAEENSNLSGVAASFLKSLDSSLTISMFGMSVSARRRRHSNFSEAVLESLGLIERFERRWVLSTIGEEFVRSVSEPMSLEPEQIS